MISDLIMPLILCAAAIGAGWTLIHMHRSAKWQNFSLLDLLMENDRVSRIAVITMGAFFVTTWAFVYDVLKHGLDVAKLGAYGGMWVVPLISKIFGNRDNDQKGQT